VTSYHVGVFRVYQSCNLAGWFYLRAKSYMSRVFSNLA